MKRDAEDEAFHDLIVAFWVLFLMLCGAAAALGAVVWIWRAALA